MVQQILGCLRRGSALEIGRRSDDGISLYRLQMNRNHVSRYCVSLSYACIEAFRHDVYRAILRDEIHLHVGITAYKFQEDWRENAPSRSNGTVDSERAHGFVPVAV